jgi:pimeloyl-ACP methyl ester carboxylesterase
MTAPVASHVDTGGDGPAVLWLHGLGGGHRYWTAELDAFSPRWRNVAWTMPGYDDSPPLAEMTFPALADAAARLLDELAVPSAVVVGHSMGGMVAQELWVRHPDRVAALALVGTSDAFGGGRPEFVDAFLQQRQAPLDAGRTPADMAPATIAGLAAGELPEPALRVAVGTMSAITSDAYRAALRCLVSFDRRTELATITVPVLMLTGEHDPLAPPKVMAAMAERVDGAELVVVPGAGHLVNLEAPDAFRDAIDGWLDRLAVEARYGGRRPSGSPR